MFGFGNKPPSDQESFSIVIEAAAVATLVCRECDDPVTNGFLISIITKVTDSMGRKIHDDKMDMYIGSVVSLLTEKTFIEIKADDYESKNFDITENEILRARTIIQNSVDDFQQIFTT